MKCKNCNREIKDTLRFCSFCGEKVEKPEDPAPAEALKESAAAATLSKDSTAGAAVKNTAANKSEGAKNGADPAAQKKKESSKKAIKIIIILLIVFALLPVALILLAVIIAAIFIFSNGGFDNFEDFNFADQFGSISIEGVVEEETSDEDEPYDNSQWEDTTANVPVTEEIYPDETEAPELDETEYDSEAETTRPQNDTTAVQSGIFDNPDTTAPEETTYSEYDDGRRVIIANGGLRIRNAPNLSAGILGLIPNGTIVYVERFENNWAYTSIDGVYGWCSCDYLFKPFEYYGTAIYKTTVTVDAGVQIVSDEYEDADILYTLVPKGEIMYVYKIEGDRAYVSYNNIYGWCSTENLVYESLY